MRIGQVRRSGFRALRMLLVCALALAPAAVWAAGTEESAQSADTSKQKTEDSKPADAAPAKPAPSDEPSAASAAGSSEAECKPTLRFNTLEDMFGAISPDPILLAPELAESASLPIDWQEVPATAEPPATTGAAEAPAESRPAS